MSHKETQSAKGRAFANIAFSSSVQNVQEKLGSRRQMSKMQVLGNPHTELDENLIKFIQTRISIYLSTANKDGIPYIQHRGGAPGFIEVVDTQTLRIRDYPGNRQYITMGNVQENPNAFIFMMDYEAKARVKFWGKMEIENLERKDRALLFHIEAWDMNCPKHIPDYFSMATVRRTMEKMSNRIAELEAEVARLSHNR